VGEIDRSHRKLAHRGSYLHRVWVSPASVYRVLAAHDLVLPKPPGRAPVQRRPWPEWISYRPNQVWVGT
jgi:putative transposase